MPEMRASDWVPGNEPVEVDVDAPRDPACVRWVELRTGDSGPEELARRLEPACPGLTAEMLADLLAPDDEPQGKVYERSIKLASSCAVVADSHEPKERRGTVTRVGGTLEIQPVELIAGEGWLISCWHPSRVFRGAEEVRGEPAEVHPEIRATLARRWANGTGRIGGDLGVILLHELSFGYGDAHRAIDRWLEDWELSYHQDLDIDGDSLPERRRQLTELWGSMAVLRDWIRPQNKAGLGEDIEKAWLPATEHELVIKVDDRIDRALESIRQLAESLRGAFSLLHVQQLEDARERREVLMRRIEIGAAAFLIPSLIVGLYGANTWIPGQGSHGGFWVMLAVLILLSLGGVMLVMRWQRGDEEPAADAGQ